MFIFLYTGIIMHVMYIVMHVSNKANGYLSGQVLMLCPSLPQIEQRHCRFGGGVINAGCDESWGCMMG